MQQSQRCKPSGRGGAAVGRVSEGRFSLLDSGEDATSRDEFVVGSHTPLPTGSQHPRTLTVTLAAHPTVPDIKFPQAADLNTQPSQNHTMETINSALERISPCYSNHNFFSSQLISVLLIPFFIPQPTSSRALSCPIVATQPRIR